MCFTILAFTGYEAFDIVLSVVSIIAGILLATRVYTELRYFIQSRGNAGRFEGREPLTLPYTIPWIGGIPRLMGGHQMYFYAKSMSPQERPVTLPVGPLRIYVLFGPKNIKMIFKNTKTLSKMEAAWMILRNMGVPREDMDIFESDHSGLAAQSSDKAAAGTRVMKKTHDLGSKYLSNGHSVNILTSRFINHFIDELDKEPLNHQYTTSLYDHFRKAMFVGSTKALVGTEFFSLCPDLADCYWDFDGAFPKVGIGLPKILFSKQYAATERMQEYCKKWVNHAWENFDPDNEEADWEESFGSGFSRNMVKVLAECGITRDGQACAMIPIIWAINSNAIPCASWMLIEALKRPGLLQTLRSEVAPSMIKHEKDGLRVDLPSLLANSPLLISMYMECLRARTSSNVVRKVVEDTECDGYILKKGNHIMSASWQPAHGSIWDIPGHSANSFWPERFIEMPKMKPSDPDEKSDYEKAMRPEEWYPYGGGNVMCSGRFFAKQEILAAVAIFVTKYDIEFQGWVDGKGKLTNKAPQPDEALAGGGVLPPDGDVRVKMCRVC